METATGLHGLPEVVVVENLGRVVEHGLVATLGSLSNNLLKGERLELCYGVVWVDRGVARRNEREENGGGFQQGKRLRSFDNHHGNNTHIPPSNAVNKHLVNVNTYQAFA